jgi:hypothetical protein
MVTIQSRQTYDGLYHLGRIARTVWSRAAHRDDSDASRTHHLPHPRQTIEPGIAGSIRPHVGQATSAATPQ